MAWQRTGWAALGVVSCVVLASGCAPRSGGVVASGSDDPAVERLRTKAAKYAARGPKRTDEPDAAMAYFYSQRLAPGMTTYPIEQVQRAAAGVRVQEGLRGGVMAGDIASWAEIGPGNIGGRTRAFVIDPGNPNVMYAGGVAGGVFKSTDAGASWTPTDDSLLNIAVTSLVMDPTDSDTLYAGTGEGFFNGDAVRGLGIFKTEDGGATWTQLASTVEPAAPFGAFFRVNKLQISPNDGDRIYAATRFGVYRSLDAGASWSNILVNPFQTGGSPASQGSFAGATDIQIQPGSNPDVLLAAFGSFTNDGLYRSVNGGDTWTRITDPDIDRFNQGRMSIGFSESNPQTVYLCMADNGNGAGTGQLVDVFRSTDGGVTWSARVNMATELGPLLLSNPVYGSGCATGSPVVFSQGWYDIICKVDPTDPSIVWVGGVDLFRSDDGGVNWGIASYWFLDGTYDPYAHADHHGLAFHPGYNGTTNQTMFNYSDGGVYRTDNALAATTLEDCPFIGDFDDEVVDPTNFPDIVWTSLNNGYGVTQYYHGAVATTQDRFVGGAQDNGTTMVESTGALNGWFEIFGGDGGYCAINPDDPDQIFVETQTFGQIRRSDDGGATFIDANTGLVDGDGDGLDSGLFITPFAMDPSTPATLWTGGGQPWRTTDSGDNWSTAGPFFTATVSDIAVAPSDSDIVYMGLNNGDIAKSVNATAANPGWTTFSGGNGLGSAGFISDVEVDPTDPDIAYATSSTFGATHVFKTVNGGTTWTGIDGDIFKNGVPEVPVHCVAVRPCNTQQVYVGTEVGVFASDDGGATWDPASLGFPTTVVEELTFRSDNRLVAFTHGRGAFVATLVPCPGACFADCDGNAVLNVDDIDCYVAAFLSGNLALADCDGNGVLNVDDIDCFVASFLGGCK